MNIKRPLIPGFLNKLDKYFLLHKPVLWSTRVHLALYYSLLFIAVLTFTAFIFPDDPRNEPILSSWTGFVIIISVIALIIWLIYLLRFNVFKRFGQIKRSDSPVVFLLYFITIAVIAFFAFIPSFVQSFKAYNTYKDIEIIHDINAINIKIAQLEHDSRKHNWTVDTFTVSKEQGARYSYDQEAEDIAEASDEIAISARSNYNKKIDSATLREHLLIDSVIKVNDSMYAFFEAPKYNFLDVYQYNYSVENRNKQDAVLSDRDIFEQEIRNFKRPDKILIKKQLNELVAKYVNGVNYHYSYMYSEKNRTYENRMFEKYDLETIKNSMQNIEKRKIEIPGTMFSGLLHLLYNFSLLLTLLIFIFRHSTPATFFLSILSGFILTTIAAIILVFSRSVDYVGYIFIIGYFILFLVITAFVWRNKTRKVVTGIGINLFVFMLPFMPLATTMFCFEVYENKNSENHALLATSEVLKDQFVLYAQIAGAVLLLTLIVTYVHSLYRRWYSLPVA